MGLFGGGASGPRGTAAVEQNLQHEFNKRSFDIQRRLQEIVQGNVGVGINTSGFPRAVPGDNALLEAFGVSAGEFGAGTDPSGALVQGGLSQLLAGPSAAERVGLLDSDVTNEFFDRTVARPLRRDFDDAVNQAAAFAGSAGLGRSGGLQDILGRLTTDFTDTLAGERSRLQFGNLQRAVDSEEARLGRIPAGVSLASNDALARLRALEGAGLGQFQREGLRGAEEQELFLLGQPFNNPFVLNFLNAGLGQRLGTVS